MRIITLKCEQTYNKHGQIVYEEYRLNGKLHNENGVAYKEWHDNGQIKYEDYHINGEELTKEQFEKINKSCNCNGKIVEVEGKKYKLIAI